MSDVVELGEKRGQVVARAISVELRRAARKARAPLSIVSGGGGFRARRGERWFIRGIYLSFVVFVLLPLLAASVYMGLVAAPQYMTETRLTLRSAESSIMDGLTGVAGLPASQKSQDALVIGDYILSRGMVEALEKNINLREMFSRPEADFLFGFNPEKPIEDLVKYWRRQVDVNVDSMSGIITIEVRAFRPEDSLAIIRNISLQSENLVNRLTSRIHADNLERARKVLADAQEKRLAALERMQKARNAQGVIDGTVSATGLEKTVLALNLELSQLQQLQDIQASSLDPNSPSSKVLLIRINSVKSQIDKYRGMLAGQGSENSLATKMKDIELRKTELTISEKQYASGVAEFEKARVEAQTQQSYLVPVVMPVLPEKALYPRRMLIWALVFVPALFLWTLGVATAYLIRDYMA